MLDKINSIRMLWQQTSSVNEKNVNRKNVWKGRENNWQENRRRLKQQRSFKRQ